MNKGYPTLVVLLSLASVNLVSCTEMRETDVDKETGPAQVEHVRGTDLSLVTLTEKAVERIDLRTTKVREQETPRSSGLRIVVPYSSLIYDPDGKTWIYVDAGQPRTFIRHPVEVDYIEGGIAILNQGPPVDTVVASVGVAELYGTEFHVGH